MYQIGVLQSYSSQRSMGMNRRPRSQLRSLRRRPGAVLRFVIVGGEAGVLRSRILGFARCLARLEAGRPESRGVAVQEW